MIDFRRAIIAALFASAATAAMAQEQTGGPTGGRGRQAQEQGQQNGRGGPGVLSLLPADAVTEHSIDLSDGKLAYTATAGTLSLFDQSGERLAAIFYTAYVAKSDNPSSRPLTFVFNGGPGAGSAFLNLGLVGPRIVPIDTAARDGTNARLQDNPDTWLNFTDLVLIDPIGAGWSRPAKPDGGKDFWGVESDAGSMAKAIALYVAKNGRTASRKFILGESYGGFRAVKVADAIKQQQGIIISGIAMVSPMLEGAFQFGGNRFALGAALQLPSLAAAELERTGKFSEAALAEAEHFALTDYLTMLAGRPPQGEAAKAFYARVARMTGLPEDVVTRTHGFIRDAFVKSLRGSDHKIVSDYDATFTVDDPNPESQSSRGPDPLLDGAVRAYGSAFVGYVRDELGFKTEMTYNLLASDIAGKWDWGHSRSQPSVSQDLRELLALTPSFRVIIAHGYTDMVTPYAVTRYVLDHMPQTGEGDRVQLKLYRGGHMFYIDAQSRKAFTADARAMYASQ